MDQEKNQDIKFFPVSRGKFIVFCLVTFGFYELYWHYRNWKYLKEHNEEYKNIWPIWRAIFAPIWYYSFLRAIDKENSWVVLALAYFVVAISYKLPDPYWIISISTCLFLLPAVQKIDDLNISAGISKEQLKNIKGYHWNIVNSITTFFVSPLLILSFIGILAAFVIIPSNQVITGSRLWAWDANYLVQNKIIEENESIVYFYTGDLFSIKNSGVVITDKGITTYEMNKKYELQITKVDFSEIDRIHFKDGEIMNDASIEIFLVDGSSFEIFLSIEANKHKEAAEFIRNNINN